MVVLLKKKLNYLKELSNIDGFVETKESNNIVQQITIKPGLIEYLYLSEKEKNNY